MLVLTRKYNQSIMIGDDIEIIVIDIKGDQVKIGINAPRSCTILRSEIVEQIQRENALAAAAAPDALSRVDHLLKPGATGTEPPPGLAPPPGAAGGPPRKSGVTLPNRVKPSKE